ncbi:hypothetical protein E0L36_19430 [Streptomyces sp. AJS327]|nr:hypothetical protein [Streptomyces sp. AJS327]
MVCGGGGRSGGGRSDGGGVRGWWWDGGGGRLGPPGRWPRGRFRTGQRSVPQLPGRAVRFVLRL